VFVCVLGTREYACNEAEPVLDEPDLDRRNWDAGARDDVEGTDPAGGLEELTLSLDCRRGGSNIEAAPTVSGENGLDSNQNAPLVGELHVPLVEVARAGIIVELPG